MSSARTGATLIRNRETFETVTVADFRKYQDDAACAAEGRRLTSDELDVMEAAAIESGEWSLVHCSVQVSRKTRCAGLRAFVSQRCGNRAPCDIHYAFDQNHGWRTKEEAPRG